MDETEVAKAAGTASFEPMAVGEDVDPLAPREAIAEMANLGWKQVLALGVTDDGDLEVINSAMTAERALWLLEWGRRWALGLTEPA